MSELTQSSFKMVSFGTVAETKNDNSDYIKVVLVEKSSRVTGEAISTKVKPGKVDYKKDTDKGRIAEHSISFDVEIPNAQGVLSQTSMEGAGYCVAKWIGESNRTSAPDVVEGETVQVYQNADTGEYYWQTWGRAPALRGKETILIVLSNIDRSTQENFGTVVDKESAYWIEFSTKEKHLHIHTSANDGEPFIYDVVIDSGQGHVYVKDSSSNEIGLNSAEGKFYGHVLEDAEFTAKRIKLKASESVTFETPTFENKSDKTNNAGDVETTGSTNMKSGFVAGKGASGKAGSIDGDFEVRGKLEGASSAEFESVTSHQPMHAPEFIPG